MKDITYSETAEELNRRGYYEESALPASPPGTQPPTPEKPVTAPFMERFGKLIVLGLTVAFLLAIYPGQEG